jgi:hypothetical protein
MQLRLAVALLVAALAFGGVACRPVSGPSPGPALTPPTTALATPAEPLPTPPAGPTPAGPTESPAPGETPPAETPPGEPPPGETPPGETPASSPGQPGQDLGITGWQRQADVGFTVADAPSAAIATGRDGVGGGRLFAVGSSEDGDVGVAAAWSSADGSGWTRQQLPDAALSALQSVADGPAGLVAVGFSYGAEVPAPVVWRSADGDAWQRVADPALGAGEMRAVAGGPRGYLALGVEEGAQARTVMWQSQDGLAWSGPAVVGAIPTGSTINGLIASADGYLAYGSLPTGAPSDQPVIWLSVDGTSWEQLEVPGPPGGVVNDVSVGADVIVAVGAAYGEDDLGEVLTWLSNNGREWELTSDGSTAGAMSGVAAFGGGFVAVGAIEHARFLFDAAAWSSVDGRTWTRLSDDPSFEQARLYDVIPAGDRLAAIGERGLDQLAEEIEPAVWLSY